MKIPAFWAKGTAEDVDSKGKKLSFALWRSSDTSLEDAHESALAAAQNALRRILAGQELNRYGYREVPLREEVVDEYPGPQDELTAVVTRNSYGALVLNTARIWFADLDFPLASVGQHLRYVFARLFNKSAVSPEARNEQDTRDRAARFYDANPRWNIRLYRTAGGMRALAIHDLMDPLSETAIGALLALECDPLYVQLCKAQQCFRARLTPKPWRCGCTVPPGRWPFENDQAKARFEAWNADYLSRQAPYATCRFVGELGSGTIHPEIRPIVELHDTLTRCQKPLELA